MCPAGGLLPPCRVYCEAQSRPLQRRSGLLAPRCSICRMMGIVYKCCDLDFGVKWAWESVFTFWHIPAGLRDYHNTADPARYVNTSHRSVTECAPAFVSMSAGIEIWIMSYPLIIKITYMVLGVGGFKFIHNHCCYLKLKRTKQILRSWNLYLIRGGDMKWLKKGKDFDV